MINISLYKHCLVALTYLCYYSRHVVYCFELTSVLFPKYTWPLAISWYCLFWNMTKQENYAVNRKIFHNILLAI